MADYFGAAEDLLGGLGGFLGGSSASKGAKAASKAYAKAAQLTLLETGIKETAASRNIYQVLGGARADIAASGLKNAGSAADLMRSSAQQGAITKAIIGIQGQIDYSSLTAQSQAAAQQASASSSGGWMSAIGGVLGAVGSIFSDDRLKQDVQLIWRRADGLGLYSWRYLGSKQLWEGVIASEVSAVYPEAIWYDDAGFMRVDYDKINMPLREAGTA